MTGITPIKTSLTALARAWTIPLIFPHPHSPARIPKRSWADMRLADKMPFFIIYSSRPMTPPAGTPFASHVSISWLPEFSPVDATFTCFSGFCHLFSPYLRGPNSPLVQSLGTHLNNISPAPAADHSMHCFRRWMTYETWWVGCMNYLRPSFAFLFSLFRVSISFSFPKRILRWPPVFGSRLDPRKAQWKTFCFRF